MGQDNISSAPPNKELMDIERTVQTTIKEQSVSIDLLEEAKSPMEENQFLMSKRCVFYPNRMKKLKTAAVCCLSPLDNRLIGELFLEGFDDGDWLLQHVAVTTHGDAKNWRDQHGALSNALIVPIISGDLRIHEDTLEVTGPYSSKKEALTFLKVPGVPADYYPRTVRSLRAVIPASLLE